jgi:hypothetical protein
MAGFNLDDFAVVKAETLKEPHSITIYGPPGKGKTVFAASISEVPGFERTLILDTEAGAVSVGAWYPKADVLPCSTAAIFSKAVEALVAGKLVERTSGLPYQAVIIDTLDKAQARQLDVFAKSPEARTSSGGDNPLYKWGAIKIWTEKLSDALHQADFLTIFVVHSEDHKSEDNGTVTTTVMLGGASRFNFPSVSDAVGYFNVVKVKGEQGKPATEHRSVDFRVQSKFITKQRFADRLNGVILDPDMPKIFSKIRGTDTTTN